VCWDEDVDNKLTSIIQGLFNSDCFLFRSRHLLAKVASRQVSSRTSLNILAIARQMEWQENTDEHSTIPKTSSASVSCRCTRYGYMKMSRDRSNEYTHDQSFPSVLAIWTSTRLVRSQEPEDRDTLEDLEFAIHRSLHAVLYKYSTFS
jgi:hypothetical protein